MTQPIPVIGQRVKCSDGTSIIIGYVMDVSKYDITIQWDGEITNGARRHYQYRGKHTISRWNYDIFPDDDAFDDTAVSNVKDIAAPSHCSGCNNPNEWGAPANRGSKFVCGSCRNFGA